MGGSTHSQADRRDGGLPVAALPTLRLSVRRQGNGRPPRGSTIITDGSGTAAGHDSGAHWRAPRIALPQDKGETKRMARDKRRLNGFARSGGSKACIVVAQ